MATNELVTKLRLDSKSFDKGISDSQKQMVAFVAAAAAVSAATFALAKKTAEYQDELTKAARRAGETTEAFSGLAHAAKLSGLEVTTLSSNMSKLAGPEAEKRLARLGISMQDVSGKTKSTSQLMSEVADQVAAVESPTEKARIAITAFGEEGAKLVSLLDNGSAGLSEMQEEARLLGVAFSDEAGRAAEKFNDDLTKLDAVMQGTQMTVGTMVIELINQSGAIELVTDSIAGALKWFNSLDQSTRDLIANVVAANAVVLGITATVIGLKVAIAVITPILAKAGVTMTAALGPVGIAIAAITAATIALTAANQAAIPETVRMADAHIEAGKSIRKLEGDLKKLEHAQKGSSEELKLTADSMEKLATMAAKYGVAIDTTNTNLEYMKGRLQAVREEQRKQLEITIRAMRMQAVMAFQDIADSSFVGEEFSDFAGSMAIGIQTGLLTVDEALERWKEQLGSFRATLDEAFINSFNVKTLSGLATKMNEAEATLAAIPDVGNPAADSIRDVGRASEEATTKMSDFSSKAADMQKSLADVASGMGKPDVNSYFEEFTSGGIYRVLGRGIADAGIKIGETLGMSISDGAKAEIQGAAGKIGDMLQQIADAALKNLQATAELEQAKFDALMQNVDWYVDYNEQAIERELEQRQNALDQELQALQEQKDALLEAEESYQQKLDIMRSEYAEQRKAELDEEMEAEFERLDEMYARQLEKFEAANISSIELDAKKQDALAEKEQKKAQLMAQYDERLKRDLENNEKDLTIKAEIEKEQRVSAEEELAARIQEIEDQKAQAKEQAEARKAEAQKQAAMIEWVMGRNAFEASKKAQIAQAQVQMAMGVMNAMVAGALLAATVPIIGWVLGPALAVALSAMVVSAGMQSIAAINMQQYPPPPVEAFAEGGITKGPSIAGEDGPEMVIPMSKPGKDFGALKGEVARQLTAGARGSGQPINVNISNTFNERQDYTEIKDRLMVDIRDGVRSAVAGAV